jgi:IS5 family transposase
MKSHDCGFLNLQDAAVVDGRIWAGVEAYSVSGSDFLRTRFDQMINLHHPLAVLASRMPWTQIEAQLTGAGGRNAGRPRLPVRLLVALLHLKHAYKLSDEKLVERWAENVVWQDCSGQQHYEPRLPCNATQVGNFRSAIGEAGVEELLKATCNAAL